MEGEKTREREHTKVVGRVVNVSFLRNHEKINPGGSSGVCDVVAPVILHPPFREGRHDSNDRKKKSQKKKGCL